MYSNPYASYLPQVASPTAPFYNSFQQNQFPQQASQAILPQQQVLQVNGKASVDTIRMAPNSSLLAMDTSAPIVWLCVSVVKGETAVLTSPTTISLNRCGVYMVACNASTETANTIQLTKDGVLQPQAQSTGTSPSFVTLVQVDRNNTCCCCSSPVVLNVTLTTAGTLDANIVVTKVC